MVVEITCVDKPDGNIQNPHEAISRYGWVNTQNQNDKGIASRVQMVNFLRKAGNAAVVYDPPKNRFVYCYVNRRGTTEFLQTKADGIWTDNLLSLSKCPR